MLMLGLELEVGPGRSPLPEHLGGVLHGVVEAALLAHSPRSLDLIRPQGDHAPARFSIQAPRPDALRDGLGPLPLTFGVTLYGAAVSEWEALVQALFAQTARRIQGRSATWQRVRLHSPGKAAIEVWNASSGWQPVHQDDAPSLSLGTDHLRSLAWTVADLPAGLCRLHRLDLHSPLLLASRSAAREQLSQHGHLPWPSLGSVLDSLAQRLIALEPDLAAQLGLAPGGWTAGPQARQIAPLTPADRPAQQVQWTYQASARSQPGITGSLLYPASADPQRCRLEAALLHWGQWLGLGQKTTMGCGRYTWTAF